MKNWDDDLRVAVGNAWSKLGWPDDNMQTGLTRAYNSIKMTRHLFREAKNLKPRRRRGRNPGGAMHLRLLVYWLCNTCEKFTGEKASQSKKTINYILAVCQAAEPNLLKSKKSKGGGAVTDAVKKWMKAKKGNREVVGWWE